MNQIATTYRHDLRIGDRLVREKGPLFSKHHGIYVGIHHGIPVVAENQYGKGVQYISFHDFVLGNSNNLTRIEKFRGTEYQRNNVIPRINQLIGTSYDLINFNCEHFSELIQNGKSSSKQVENTFLALAAIFVIGLLSSK